MAARESTIKLTRLAATAILEKLGSDLIAIDLSEQMVLSEVFLIATGRNERQVEAIADEVERVLALSGRNLPDESEANLGSFWIIRIWLCISRAKRFVSTTCSIASGMTAPRSNSVTSWLKASVSRITHEADHHLASWPNRLECRE